VLIPFEDIDEVKLLLFFSPSSSNFIF